MEQRIWHFEWHSAMGTGHPEIDSDHQETINLVSELIESILGMQKLMDIHHRVQQVLDHTVRHFALEEQFLKQWNYHDLDRHSGIHATIIRKLGEVKQSINSSTTMDHWMGAGLSIRNILMEHFFHEDLKFKDLHLSAA